MGIFACLKEFFTPYEPRFGENGQLYTGVDKPSLIFINMVMQRILRELPTPTMHGPLREDLEVKINGASCVLNIDKVPKEYGPLHINSLFVYTIGRDGELRQSFELGLEEKKAICEALNKWKKLKEESDKNKTEFDRQNKALEFIEAVFKSPSFDGSTKKEVQHART